MVSTVWLCAIIQRRLSRLATTREALGTGVLTLAVVMGVIALSGQFGAGGGLPLFDFSGYLSMNLLSPFVPQKSGLLPGLGGIIDATGGQYGVNARFVQNCTPSGSVHCCGDPTFQRQVVAISVSHATAQGVRFHACRITSSSAKLTRCRGVQRRCCSRRPANWVHLNRFDGAQHRRHAKAFATPIERFYQSIETR